MSASVLMFAPGKASTGSAMLRPMRTCYTWRWRLNDWTAISLSVGWVSHAGSITGGGCHFWALEGDCTTGKQRDDGVADGGIIAAIAGVGGLLVLVVADIGADREPLDFRPVGREVRG